MQLDSSAPQSVVVVDTSGTERDFVVRLRSALAASIAHAGTEAVATDKMLAAHHPSPSTQGPAVSVFVAKAPKAGLRKTVLAGSARVVRREPVAPLQSAGVAIFERTAAEVLLGSCDASSTAPATPALIALACAHGFHLKVHSDGQLDADFATTLDPTPAPISREAMKSLALRVKAIRKQHNLDQTEWAKRFPGFGGQAPAAGSTYAGSQELHSLSKSVRFHRWMAEMLRPAIGQRVGAQVLEVGAGIGTMTRALAETYPNSAITSIEPDPALFPLLVDRVAGTGVTTATQSTLELDPVGTFDTVLYVNVLEHIEDHAGELRRALQLLRPGGHIGIIVPALPGLYGSLDAKTGHYRRYQKAALREVVQAAGFTVTDLHYFDTVGVAPYWVSIKLGSMPALSDRTTMLFDNVLVPMSKLVHRTWKSVPLGKNLLLIAFRP